MTTPTPPNPPNPLSSLLTQRSHLTTNLQDPDFPSKFSPTTFLHRASTHATLKYSDLAIGDAYRALLVIDEVFDESSQYHFKVVNEILRPFPKVKAEWGELHRRADDCDSTDEGRLDTLLGCENIDDGGGKVVDIAGIEADQERIRDFAQTEARKLSLQAYRLLVDRLKETQCLKTAYEFGQRGLKVFPGDTTLQKRLKSILGDFSAAQKAKDSNFTMQDFDPQLDLPDQGYARREIYPWNTHEPLRCNEAELQSINARLKAVAPLCEVRAVELPSLQSSTSPSHTQKNTQLGLFATEDLPAGNTILREPSMITASLRAHNNLCDACTAPLPNILSSSPTTSEPGPFPCPSCPSDDILFCSRTCLSLAQSTYHPAICGIPEYDHVAKDPREPGDAANNLYFLLLARIFAISLTQSLHPLDLPEVRFLWGDFSPASSSSSPSTSNNNDNINKTLPFSFKHNILYPIHLLTQLELPDIPPWDISLLDTWVVNTLYAKIRGVASARMGRDGKPEAGAVHGMWCLANHSCAPNVWWELGSNSGSGSGSGADSARVGESEGKGEMRMIVRTAEERVRWGHEPNSAEEQEQNQEKEGIDGEEGEDVGDDDSNREGSKSNDKKDSSGCWDGIRKGEQILNHYCDISLPVAARREWAKGALGGTCVCERCVWEESCYE